MNSGSKNMFVDIFPSSNRRIGMLSPYYTPYLSEEALMQDIPMLQHAYHAKMIQMTAFPLMA